LSRLGSAFARAISSATPRTGTEGCTTSRLALSTSSETGVKSFTGW
jgi:hypothetical protein